MNDFGSLFGGLPPWVQALGIVAIVGAAAWLGRRGVRARRGSGSPRAGVDRTRRGWVEPPQSPGSTGRHATRDLTSAEMSSLRFSYAPQIDGEPDPGEVVWTWVPYVENDGRGKDRPVLIVARIDEVSFAGCYLSTKQHRGFVSVGTGGWDTQGRESFLSPERVLRVWATGMRREGQVLPRQRFDRAVATVAATHNLRTQ